jgi:hypothetical protein
VDSAIGRSSCASSEYGVEGAGVALAIGCVEASGRMGFSVSLSSSGQALGRLVAARDMVDAVGGRSSTAGGGCSRGVSAVGAVWAQGRCSMLET